jgi:hypothetical protein
MPQHCYLDGFLIFVMLIGIVGTLYHRIHGEYGIGDRAIQFVGICLVIPTVAGPPLRFRQRWELMLLAWEFSSWPRPRG